MTTTSLFALPDRAMRLSVVDGWREIPRDQAEQTRQALHPAGDVDARPSRPHGGCPTPHAVCFRGPEGRVANHGSVDSGSSTARFPTGGSRESRTPAPMSVEGRMKRFALLTLTAVVVTSSQDSRQPFAPEDANRGVPGQELERVLVELKPGAVNATGLAASSAGRLACVLSAVFRTAVQGIAVSPSRPAEGAISRRIR